MRNSERVAAMLAQAPGSRMHRLPTPPAHENRLRAREPMRRGREALLTPRPAL